MNHEFLGWAVHQVEWSSKGGGISLKDIAAVIVEPGTWHNHKVLHVQVWKSEPRAYRYADFSFAILLEDKKGKK